MLWGIWIDIIDLGYNYETTMLVTLFNKPVSFRFLFKTALIKHSQTWSHVKKDTHPVQHHGDDNEKFFLEHEVRTVETRTGWFNRFRSLISEKSKKTVDHNLEPTFVCDQGKKTCSVSTLATSQLIFRQQHHWIIEVLY